ncbi:MAG: hypothetical protein LBK29_02045 [Oscillospiraceae bacterium]|jgi:hypothetical protein|nr:hypothetical protein [Oscillospiraceae bacterium]
MPPITDNWKIKTPNIFIKKVDESAKDLRNSVEEFKKITPWLVSINRQSKIKAAKEIFNRKVFPEYQKFYNLALKYGKSKRVKEKIKDVKKTLEYTSNFIKKRFRKNEDSGMETFNSVFRTPETRDQITLEFLSRVNELEDLRQNAEKEHGKLKQFFEKAGKIDLRGKIDSIKTKMTEIKNETTGLEGSNQRMLALRKEFKEKTPKIDCTPENKNAEELSKQATELGLRLEEMKKEYKKYKKINNEEYSDEKKLKGEFEILGTVVKNLGEQIKEYQRLTESGDYNPEKESESISKYLLSRKNFVEKISEIDILEKTGSIEDFEKDVEDLLTQTKECKDKSKKCKEKLESEETKYNDFVEKELKKTFILHAGTGIKAEWVNEEGKVDFTNPQAEAWYKSYKGSWKVKMQGKFSQLPSCHDALVNGKIEGQYTYALTGKALFGGGAGAGNMIVKNSKECKCDGKYIKHLTDSKLIDFIRKSYNAFEWTS